MRCLSAVDIALWDILGQQTGQPVWQLLGGNAHPDGVLVYNTCASAGYAQGTPGIPRANAPTLAQNYRDFEAWQPGADAGKLAKSLLEMGIRGMKIWPFDPFALRNRGQTISWPEVEEGLRPWQQIRDAVGLEMDVILEGHGYWALQPARRIAEALEPYKPALLEDLMKPDNLHTLAKLRAATRTPICASELLMNRYAVQEMIEANACDVVMTDVAWSGGFTEARKIATLADTHNMGVIFHDCSGPVTLGADLHMATHCTNSWMQEIVRAYTLGFFRDLVDFDFVVEDGRMKAPTRPGLGMALRPEVFQREDCVVRVLAEAK
jgi:L-alanine-DL-glutamate epimerase-like enolase superfamily enzyme